VVIAGALVIAAVRFDSPRLAFVASFLAMPTIWLQRSAILFALLTLENDRWLRPYLWPWARGTVSGRDPGSPPRPASPAADTAIAP
jgi:hypothetical protein